MKIPEDLPRPELKTATTLDRIHAWYRQEPVELTEKEVQQMHRYKFAFACMLNNELDSDTVDKIASHFNISDRQAYRDLSEAKKLYPQINEADKVAQRYILTQYLQQCYNLAKAKGDIKHMIKAASEIGKINGLDKSDPNLPDPSAFQASQYIIQLNSTTINQAIDLKDLASLPKEKFNILLEEIQQKDISDLQLIQLLNEARDTEEED